MRRLAPRLPQPSTIQSRLLAVLLAATAILAGVAAGTWRLALRPALIASVAQTREEIAAHSANRIGAFIEQRIAELVAAADFGVFWEDQRERQREIMRQLMKLSPAVAEVTIADRRGEEILRVSRTRLYTAADHGSLAGQEHFEAALLGETYLGEVYHPPTAEPYMTIAVPIRFGPREIGGVLVAEINLKTLWDPISHIQVGETGTVYVIDRRGRLLAHRDYSKVLLGTTVTHVPAALSGSTGIEQARVVRDPAGPEAFVATAPVGRAPWLVIVEEPLHVALKDVRHVERIAIGLIAAALAGGIGFAVWFSGRITRPMRQLEEGAATLARGDLSHRLQISTGDEIERLAEAFNAMADQLQASREQLELRVAERTEESEVRRQRAEALFEITRVISRSLDPNLVARAVVDRALALLHTTAATLYRLDPETGNLVALAFAGDLGPRPEGLLLIPSATGAVGAAVRERRAVVTPDVLADPMIVLSAEVRAHITQAGFRAVLAVPLIIQDKVIGVLTTGDGPGRLFDDEHIGLLQAFASQAAVALDNARLYQNARSALEDLSRTQDQLIQAQKMEAVGRLAGGIAHDFNNLLTIINGRAHLLLERAPLDGRDRHGLEIIQKTGERAAALTRHLLAFSRKQVLQPTVLDLNAVVAAVVPMLGRLVGEDVTLVFEPDLHLAKVRADAAQLEQVILNLVVNARDAMPEGGTLRLETANVTLDGRDRLRDGAAEPGAYAMLAVGDTGIGMDAETRARIFEPFFTTKAPGKGTGLGLSTVYGIVKQSGGHITVESEPAKGTTFRVYLPRTRGRDEAPAPQPRPPERGLETILLVEDEDDVRELAGEILHGYGYTVLVASRAREAVRLAERHGRPIQLLLTDVVMPEMSGRALAEQLTRLRPEMRVLYMSGYTDHAIVHHGALDPDTHFLQKPFNPEALARKVRGVLDA